MPSQRDEGCLEGESDCSTGGGGEPWPGPGKDRSLSSVFYEGCMDSDCVGACDIDVECGGRRYPVCSLPAKYYLLLTPRCNHRCVGCSNAFFSDYRVRQLRPDHDTAPLSTGQWASIIDRLAPHTESFIITGGEPTLHAGFRSVLERLESWRIPYTVFTNGNWESPQVLVSFLSQLRYLRGLLVSLHGSDAASHDRFCGTAGSFDRVTVNIRLAVAAGLRVRVSTVVTRTNAGQTNRVVALAASLGATGVAFNRYLVSPQQHLAREVLPSRDELLGAFQRIDASCKATTGESFRIVHGGPRLPQCFVSSSMGSCSAGETFCAVDPWGNVLPCVHSNWGCGNLMKQGIEAIWQGERLAQWRNLLPSDCLDCTLSQCRGGCRAAMAMFGGRDPLMARVQ